MRRLVTFAVPVVAAIALGGWAYAETQPADPQVSEAPAAAKAGRQRPGMAGMKRAIHGELLVGGPQRGYRTVVFDRGRITAISADAITLERPDGESVTVKLTEETKFNGTPRDQLKAGDMVLVAQQDGSAIRVASKGARADMAERRAERKARRQGAGTI
jgi:uncharacterized protein DUF5666